MCGCFPLSTPLCLLGFVTSMVTAVILCGSVAYLSSGNYFPAEMGFRWWLWGGWLTSVFPWGLARAPQKVASQSPRGKGKEVREGNRLEAAGDREVES